MVSMLKQEHSEDQLVEKYRRSHQRATIIAVAACFLAVGVMIGAYLSRQPTQVRAGKKEATSDLSSAFTEIARHVEPAVVNISTVTRPTQTRSLNEFPISRPSFEGLQQDGPEQARRGNGSGVIIDQQGYILTNHHVIAGADRIKVKFFNGLELTGKLIGTDREADLAVVKVEASTPLVAVRLGDSEKMRVGDWVLAIGSPFGLDQTVTAGIISAKERESSELYKRVGFQFFLQTDAAINRGNSGGPLINLDGEVIGINTAIATSTGDYNGICFALPSSEAISIYKQLVKNGRVIRGFLGAMTEPVTPQIAKVYGLPISRGAIVSNVSETMEVDGAVVESPAAKAGLKPDDIIVEFRGDQIKDDSDLVRRVAATPVGTAAPIKIFRDGNQMMLSVIIGRRPGREPAKPAQLMPRLSGDDLPKSIGLGMSIQGLTPQRIKEKELDLARGVIVIKVEPGSLADDANLKVNDVIETVNRERVSTNEDFKRVLSQLKSGDPIVFQVYREKAAPMTRIYLSLSKP